MPLLSKEESEMATVSTKEFDQESQLPFVSVEKAPTAAGDDIDLFNKVKEKRLLICMIITFFLVVVLGAVLGVVLSSSSSGGGDLLDDEVADSRLVAVMREGEKCPSSWQTNSTHIVLPPVKVTTSSGKCNAECSLTFTNSECDMAGWRRSGRKVLLSFGGEGLEECWDQCYGKEQQIATTLEALRSSYDLDGVAFVFNNPANSTELAAMKAFYIRVTELSRLALPSNALIGHIGQDSDLVKGMWYHDVVSRVGDLIDFLVAQYFDGVTRPSLEGLGGGKYVSTKDHYAALVEGCFKGDSTKLVFGFCINGCSASGSNSDISTAVSLVKQLQAVYPCNGGVSYWAGEDTDGKWSSNVRGVVEKSVRCSVEGTSGPSTDGTSVPSLTNSTNSTRPAVTPTPTRATRSPVATPLPTTRVPLPITAAPPTPVPTPVPTKPIPGCYMVIPVQRSCINDPDCCEEGTRCYQVAPFRATCLAVCNYPPRCKLIGS